PVGIVYDFDGTVTDALLGEGAGDASQCFWNAAFGGPDNFSTSGNFLHALVVINGQCAQQSSQLTDVEYRLVRVLGSVLGLGWSQVNLNVLTGNPPPTPADFAGFPVMHFMDPVSCVPITICYANPFQLAPDDMAALTRLYPAAQSTTTRIYGSVYFVDGSGNVAQPMQGVNVVARWIDPSTGQPSRQYAAASVSGFLFTGNAGNPITGFTNTLGVPFSQFGSNDPTLEGFFDLAGMVIPNGGATAQYQLTVEALDRTWSAGVCPYDPAQVTPSGASQPIVVSVAAGGDFDQDLVMAGSAQAIPPWAASETWNTPAAVPLAGDWEGSLSGYGDVAYFSIPAQANRTLSVAVTALDETGAASESKAAPVIGMWTQGDPLGTPPPALTTSPFNSGVAFAMTRLDAEVLNSNTFLIGIADLRGDGRPDYHYHAHVLYGGSLSPPRVSVDGGVAVLQGIGFDPALTVNIGSVSVPLLAVNPGQMVLAMPTLGDGLQTITINDPASGSFSTMTNVLTVGAAATDKLVLVQGSNPLTAVGTQALNPAIVKVVASDGVTPVDGATVGWSATAGTALSVCGGASACAAFTDESGMAATWLTPAAAGASTIVATLAPGVYNPAQSVVATLVATSSSLDLGVTPQNLLVAQGATVSVPLTARVLSNGAPLSGVAVNFLLAQGAGSLSAPSATTNGSGYAAVTLTLTNFTGSLLLNACVAPANNPCQTISANAVSPALVNLQEVAGAGQVIAGQTFQPVTVRVTDSSTPPNPILGASVIFSSTLMRPAQGNPGGTAGGDPVRTNPGMPVILGASQTSVASDVNGFASLVPSTRGFGAPVEIAIIVSAGTNASLQYDLEAFPAMAGGADRSAIVAGFQKKPEKPGSSGASADSRFLPSVGMTN
ncbi:MAG: Ig-like domain-containing protein, partial [Candidatus Sulfotelmatobacter sp.]